MHKYLGLLSLTLLIACLVLIPRSSQAQSSQSENPCTYTVRMTGLSASTQLINANGANSIRICYYNFSLGLNATTTAVLVWGTGSTCGSGTVDSSPKLAIGTTVTGPNVVLGTGGDGYGFIDENPVRGISNYCLIVSGSSPAVDGIVKYGLF